MTLPWMKKPKPTETSEFQVTTTARFNPYGMYGNSWELRMSVFADSQIVTQTHMIMPLDINESILEHVLNKMTRELLHAMKREKKCDKCGQEMSR